MTEPAAVLTPSGVGEEAEKRGMGAFLTVWSGQMVSLVGSQMTRFGLIFWAYEQTQRATSLTLVGSSIFLALLVFSPLAGALVDRYNRRWLLIGSALVSAGVSASLLALALSGLLKVWHVYAISLVTGAVQALAYPAFAAVTTLIVSPQQYVRAGGLLSLAQSSAAILGPPLAALLLPLIGLPGLLAIDVATFGMAAATLLVVRFPQPADGGAGRRPLMPDLLLGFRYLLEHPGARALQSLFFVSNLLSSLAVVLLAPMVLARSGQDRLALGLVQSAFGIGGVAGAAVLALCGGPRRRVPAILAASFLAGGVGQIALGLGRAPWAWAAAMFFLAFFLPAANGLYMAMWQAKVPPELQGRFSAAARVTFQAPLLLTFLLAGPLADRVFEPALQPGGALAASFGPLVGVGDGAGMGLMLVLSGILGAGVAAAGAAIPLVRDAEKRWDG